VHGAEGKFLPFWQENLKMRNHKDDPGIYQRIIEGILKKQGRTMRTGLVWISI
jgi:hypothetical protein